MLRSEIYNDLIVPATGGVVHCMSTPLAVADGRGFLSLMRTQRAGGFADADEALVAQLAPHLRQMLTLRTKLQASGRRALYAEEALDTIAFAVLRCRCDGRITYANAPAREILDQGDGLRATAYLECTSRTANAALQTRLRAVVRGVVAEGALLVERPSGRGGYRVIVVPFATSHRSSGDEALVFVHDPESQATGLLQRAAELFGLSPAEADLAVGLAQGETVQEVADRRQVRISTVRSQLQSALAKTGAARQTDLIRAVLALGATRRSL
jgi:DNA-binding CsgD family transcriptional regulator